MGILRDIFGPSKKEIWQLLSEQIGSSNNKKPPLFTKPIAIFTSKRYNVFGKIKSCRDLSVVVHRKAHAGRGLPTRVTLSPQQQCYYNTTIPILQ